VLKKNIDFFNSVPLASNFYCSTSVETVSLLGVHILYFLSTTAEINLSSLIVIILIWATLPHLCQHTDFEITYLTHSFV